MDPKLTEPVAFKFSGIEIISKEMRPAPEGGVKDLINIDVRIETRVQPADKLVVCIVTLSYREGNNEIPLGSLSVAYLFHVIDFEKHITLASNGESYAVPIVLESTIRPASLSTTRGIAYSEFRATYLAHAILPIVFMNQGEILPQNIIQNENIIK